MWDKVRSTTSARLNINRCLLEIYPKIFRGSVSSFLSWRDSAQKLTRLAQYDITRVAVFYGHTQLHRQVGLACLNFFKMYSSESLNR